MTTQTQTLNGLDTYDVFVLEHSEALAIDGGGPIGGCTVIFPPYIVRGLGTE